MTAVPHHRLWEAERNKPSCRLNCQLVSGGGGFVPLLTAADDEPARPPRARAWDGRWNRREPDASAPHPERDGDVVELVHAYQGEVAQERQALLPDQPRGVLL